MIQKYKIFHISDLHFGREHARTNTFQLRAKSTRSRNLGVPISNLIFEYLPETRAERQNTVVVCSGDLATFRQKDDFKEAVRFLTRFTTEYQIPKQQILICPGNHDVYWQDYASHNYLAMLNLFRRKFRGFPNPLRKDGPCYYFPEHHLLIYCFNSCVLCGAREQIPELDTLISQLPKNRREPADELLKRLTRIDPGFIGHEQLSCIGKNIEEKLSQVDMQEEKRLLRIAVLHHHINLIVSEFKRFASVIDAGPLKRSLSRYGFHLVLHGHKHLPYFCEEKILMDDTPETLSVLASGTMGGKPIVGRHYTFNILDVQNYISSVAKVVVNRKEFGQDGQPPASGSTTRKWILELVTRKKDNMEMAVNSLRQILSGNLPADFSKIMFNTQYYYKNSGNPIRVRFYRIDYEIQLLHKKLVTSGHHKAQHLLEFENRNNTNLDKLYLSFASTPSIPYANLHVSAQYRFGKRDWQQFAYYTVVQDDYIKIVEFYFKGEGIPPREPATVKIIYRWPNSVQFPESEWGLENWIFRDGLEKFSLRCSLKGRGKIKSANAYSAYFDSDKRIYEREKVATLEVSKMGKKVKWDSAPKRDYSIHFIRCLVAK